MLIVSGLVLIGIGLVSIFAKDIMWELTRLSNQAKGVASERTEWWDVTTTIGGIMAILLGLFIAVVGFR